MNQMLNIVIFGPPGSGKGTQSDKIIEHLGVSHISTGDVLRKEIALGTEIGECAKLLIDAGQFVPDCLIIKLLEKEYDKLNNSKGVIFDGFPRTTDQAEELKKMLAVRGADISVMLSLEVPEEELIERLVNRGKTSGRADDKLNTIKKRIKIYEERTAPVIDFYQKENKHTPIKGIGTVDTIFSRIEKALSGIV